MSQIKKWLQNQPIDLQEEVAVVPCGGCSYGEMSPEHYESLHHAATCISLPSLLAGVKTSRRRLHLAHAVITISACERDCAGQQLSEQEGLRVPAARLLTNAEPEQQWRQRLQERIAAFAKADRIAPELTVRKAGQALTPANQVTLDFRGLKCPMPIVKLSKSCKELPDSLVEVQADDAAFPADIEAWLNQKNLKLEGIDQEGQVWTARFYWQAQNKPKTAKPKRHKTQAPPSLATTQSPALPTQAMASLGELDAMRTRSPLHIVELQRICRGIAQPGTLVVHTRDKRFLDDAALWCKQTGSQILNVQQEGSKISATLMLMPDEVRMIEPTPSDRPPTHPIQTKRPPTHPIQTKRPPTHPTQAGRPPTHPSQPKRSSASKPPSHARSGFLPTVSEHKNPKTPTGNQLAVETLNCLGLRCPMPIVKLNQAIKRAPNRAIRIQADDAAFYEDLKAWCGQRGFNIDELEQSGKLITALVVPARDVPSAAIPAPKTHSYTSPTPVLPPPTGAFEPPKRRRGEPTSPVISRSQFRDFQDTVQQQSRSTRAFQPVQQTPAQLLPELSPLAAPEQESVTLDFRGLKCPMPIVKLAAEVRKHKGERFRVLADDAAFPPDLEAWCNQSQMSIQSLTREGSLHIAEIQRIKEEPTEPPTPVPVAFDSGDDLSISQEQELFTEMQEMGFWDTELPTAPTRAIHVKKLISLDMRGHTDAQIRLELASQEVQEGMGFRLLIDATTPIDPVKEWSSMYRMEVATEKEGDQRVIWLQSPSSPN